MIYRRVVNGALDGTFQGSGGIKFGKEFIPSCRLNERGFFPQITPDYDPSKETLGEYYFDEDSKIVTQPVYNFEKGIVNNWRDRVFVNDDLLRSIRVRVARKDTLSGGGLEAMANDLLKTNAPFFLVDIDGNIDANGSFVETYPVEIDADDVAALQGYISVTEGAVLEYYKDL